ncbi:pyocin knob domain-containing protein [Pseudomonas fluorescens]|uniref:pyocin knob domain-containing protein n=1 Tax=Pseudomonas fluorescens TaxID=294 RepID=UPI00383809BC
MVWQRAGTVAVVTGSTTVIGTNVDFAASSRNGDAFVGPDGATYELANVASSSVISILPAYKGPSVSGAAYAIVPVQGYDKMLSDAFNNLNNQFGPKLAALGTTGNYEVLPFSKGGTNSTSQAGALQSLGLDVTKAAVSASGVGVVSAPLRSNIFDAPGSGFTSVNPQATPNSDAPGSGYGVLLQGQYNSNTYSQIFLDSLDRNFYYRNPASGASVWLKVYHTGNTTRASDGTLKAI